MTRADDIAREIGREVGRDQLARSCEAGAREMRQRRLDDLLALSLACRDAQLASLWAHYAEERASPVDGADTEVAALLSETADALARIDAIARRLGLREGATA